jgi:adenine phosphoribosyltransferase
MLCGMDGGALDGVGTAEGSTAFRSRFRWVDGHADVWAAFQDARTLRALVVGLVESWRDERISAVAAVEARGFLLGGAVAVHLGVGFHAIRKTGALFPGPKMTIDTGEDYRGHTHELAIQVGLGPADRVLVVDDWAERGAQALAVKALVERCGAQYAGLAVIVDQLTDETRYDLAPVVSLVHARELGDPEG